MEDLFQNSSRERRYIIQNQNLFISWEYNKWLSHFIECKDGELQVTSKIPRLAMKPETSISTVLISGMTNKVNFENKFLNPKIITINASNLMSCGRKFAQAVQDLSKWMKDLENNKMLNYIPKKLWMTTLLES
jgi:hypothetical protein